MNKSGNGFWQRTSSRLARLRDGVVRIFPSALDRSLRNLLLVTLGSIFLLSFLAAAASLSAVVYRVEHESRLEHHKADAQAATQTLTLFLNRTRQILITVSLLDHSDPGELSFVTRGLLEEEGSASLLEVARLDGQGRIFGSAYRDISVLANLFTIRQSSWFQAARKGQNYLGPVQLAADGEPYLVMAIPSPDQGVVAARLDMRILWQFVADIRIGRTGRTYLVSDNGRIIAHADPAIVLANATIAARPEFAAFQQAPEQEWSGTYTNFQGDRVIGMMIRMPDTDWVTVTEIQVWESYHTVYLVLLVMGFGVLVFGVVMMRVTTSTLDRLLFRPLEELRAGAESIGHGQFDQRIELFQRNEIGQVAASFNAMAARLQDRDGQIAARTTALAVEVEAHKGAEEALVIAHRGAMQASQLKSEFLATMSHEIRTPMNGIVGMTELLSSTDMNDEQVKCLEIIRVSADALLTIINDILDLSKIEAGALALQAEDFSVQTVVENVTDVLAPATHDKKLRLRSFVSSEIPPICHGDPNRLRQVLLNLAGNGIKFTEQGEVTISADVAPGPAREEAGATALRFEIKDTGRGLTQAQIDRLFTPFTQLDGSSTRRHGGTGLGLAISRRLIELMGGEIGITSQPGEGSTFWFWVPLTPAVGDVRRGVAATRSAPAAAAEHAPAAANGYGHHAVLLVEDNLVNQKVALRQLQKLGYAATVVSNGRAAVEAVLHGRFALVLMDCQMPEMDGFEATKLIRAAEGKGGGHTPIVAMTANAMEGDREACLAAGMDHYLAKPIRMDDLRRVMDRWGTVTYAATRPVPSEEPGVIWRKREQRVNGRLADNGADDRSKHPQASHACTEL